ncbi:MAG: hypothetical protein ABWY18_19165 [Tardiphaga sp.]
MQTAIDRVIRTLTFRNAFAVQTRQDDGPASTAGEQAAERAAQLLGHYCDTLAARPNRPD